MSEYAVAVVVAVRFEGGLPETLSEGSAVGSLVQPSGMTSASAIST